MKRLPNHEFKMLIEQANKADLGALIEAELGPPVSGRGNSIYWLCPFHNDHHPSFNLNRKKNRVFCNGVCGKAWTPIRFIMDRKGMKLLDAIEYIASQQFPIVSSLLKQQPTRPYGPPPSEWQATARQLIEQCHLNLMAETETAQRVRDYLQRRGLTAETVSDARLGYNPKSGRIHGHWTWAGIIIPCFVSADLWGIKIRLLPDHPVKCQGCKHWMPGAGQCHLCTKRNKYRSVTGSQPALYGADSCQYRRVVFGCEGEFDALLVHQEAGDLGGVFSTTNGAGKNWRSEWSLQLLDAERVIILYDNDAAGERGKAKLTGLSDRVVHAYVPAGNDVTDYVVHHGGDLRAWLEIVRASALATGYENDWAQVAYLREQLQRTQLPQTLAADWRADLYRLGRGLQSISGSQL